MTRISIDLDPAIIRELKRRAKREGIGMSQVASNLLRDALDPRPRKTPAEFRWIAADLGRPRVDLDDKEAVQAILDDRG